MFEPPIFLSCYRSLFTIDHGLRSTELYRLSKDRFIHATLYKVPCGLQKQDHYIFSRYSALYGFFVQIG